MNSIINSNLTLYRVHNIEFYSIYFVQTIICLIGAALNILNVIIFLHKKFEATPYLFMIILSLADAGTLFVHLPSGWARCAKQLRICQTNSYKQLRIILFYYVTYISFGLGNILESLSAWITVLISAERYIVMKWPHLGKLHFTRNQGKWQVLITICLAILFNLPLFFTLKINKSTIVGSDNSTRRFHVSKLTKFGQSSYYLGFTWIRFIFVQCIPLIVLCVVNSMLLQLIWSSYRNQKIHQLNQQLYAKRKSIVINTTIDEDDQTQLRTETNDSQNQNRINSSNFINHQNNDKLLLPIKSNSRLERSQQANNKLSILLVAVIFLFIIGQIPQAFAYIHILEVIIPKECKNCQTLASLYRHFSQLLCLITSTTNFFLYLGLNRHFRECLKNLCSKLCRK